MILVKYKLYLFCIDDGISLNYRIVSILKYKKKEGAMCMRLIVTGNCVKVFDVVVVVVVVVFTFYY